MTDAADPGFVVLSKDGCGWCDRAKGLLPGGYLDIRCETAADLRRELTQRGHAAAAELATTFPQIMHGQAYVGGYRQLEDYLREPLLGGGGSGADAASRRFTPFPIRYHDMWGMYKRAVASFWTTEEVTLAQDVEDWKALTPDERHFVKHVLAFFAGADGIVMENLQLNFGVEVKVPEARQFYAFQTFNESQHAEMYGLLIDTLIDDPKERTEVFGAIETMPAVRAKAQWATKWLNPGRRFAERLLAFTCVEGILFSGSFCAIFWLKQRGVMPGLGLSNQFISRDEGLHQEFGALVYSYLDSPLTQAEAEAIVVEAVDNEKQFITQAIPCRLIGMNSDLMSQYIEFVADRLLTSMGYAPAYKSPNPFPWMELLSLSAKDNFFERFSSEYQKAGIMASAEDQTFGLDGDF